MRAGDLDQRITIETPTSDTNELGEEVPTWIGHSHPWAKVMETPGREFLKGDYVAESKVVFLIRWRVLDSKARVTWQDRIYDIKDITGTRRGGCLYLHCTAQDGAN